MEKALIQNEAFGSCVDLEANNRISASVLRVPGLEAV